MNGAVGYGGASFYGQSPNIQNYNDNSYQHSEGPNFNEIGTWQPIVTPLGQRCNTYQTTNLIINNMPQTALYKTQLIPGTIP